MDVGYLDALVLFSLFLKFVFAKFNNIEEEGRERERRGFEITNVDN